MRYMKEWSEFIGKLDDAQYVIEIIQHPICNAVGVMTHVCYAKHFPIVGFTCVLVGDVRDILGR